jgi:hypothetical protein
MKSYIAAALLGLGMSIQVINVEEVLIMFFNQAQQSMANLYLPRRVESHTVSAFLRQVLRQEVETFTSRFLALQVIAGLVLAREARCRVPKCSSFMPTPPEPM